MNIEEIIKKQKIKVQLKDKPNYNIFSNGALYHPAEGTIILIRKIKLNKAKTWLEFKGVLKTDPEKNIKFSIHPENINKHLKILDY